MKPKLLNLGCGPRCHEDWVNVDFIAAREGVIAHDLGRGIPFPDRSFDAVYHSHVLEHFPRERAKNFIRECYRVLKPGGVLRVVVPDLEGLAREYLEALESASRGDPGGSMKYEWMLIELLDQIVRTTPGGEMARALRQLSPEAEAFVTERIGGDIPGAIQEAGLKRHGALREWKSSLQRGLQTALRAMFGSAYEAYAVGRFRLSGEVHQWMYDRYSLSRLLKEEGFSSVERKTATESAIAGFNRYGFDLHEGHPRGRSSLFMEARRGSH